MWNHLMPISSLRKSQTNKLCVLWASLMAQTVKNLPAMCSIDTPEELLKINDPAEKCPLIWVHNAMKLFFEVITDYDTKINREELRRDRVKFKTSLILE